MNPIEITLHQRGDNKKHLRADIRCKWTPLSLQGEHFITTIFGIPDGSPLQIRLRVTENLLAIILISITVTKEEFANLFVTQKSSRTLNKGITKAWTIFWIKWTKTLVDLTRCHTSISCTLLLTYMTFELNVMCLWQHPATSNHLEIAKIEWSGFSDPIVITTHILRQLQPGNWKIPIKPGTEEQTNLLSALQEFTKSPHFKNTHPLTRYIVKELIRRQCQPSTSDDRATSPERNKTNYD